MKNFFKMLGTYFVDPADPSIVSSKRVNGFLAFIVATVVVFVTEDVSLTSAFLGLVGVEGIATLVKPKKRDE